MPTRFPRPQEGYARAQQQRRLLSGNSGSINNSNEDGYRTSSSNDRSSVTQWLSSLPHKVLHGSILSDVIRWTITSSGHVPASLQHRPTTEKDAISKRENVHTLQSTEAARGHNGIRRSETSNDLDTTASSRAADSGSLVFVTTDSDSAGRAMATILAPQYRVVSSSSLSLSRTPSVTASLNGSTIDALLPSSAESGASISFKFVHASSIAAEISKSIPSTKAGAVESNDSSQDEAFAARLGPVLDWWLLGEFDHVASCGTTFRYATTILPQVDLVKVQARRLYYSTLLLLYLAFCSYFHLGL